MAEYRASYDSRLPQLESAIDSMPGTPESIILGLNKQKIRRFFQRFSVLFGRLDRNGAKHPQFLSLVGANIPDQIISSIDPAISQMSSGSATFLVNLFPTLVEMQDKLERAIGLDSATLSQISISAAKDLAGSVIQSDELLEKSNQSFQKIEELSINATAMQKSIQQWQQSSKSDVDLIAASRQKAEDLLSVDGRKKESLEKIMSQVHQKQKQISDMEDVSKDVFNSILQLKIDVGDVINDIKNTQISISGSEIEARRVLGLSAQAGLARSYLSESRKLEKRSNIFTTILYCTAIVTIALAAFYVLPSLEIVINHGSNNEETKLLITLLRASILTPLIFVLYFTQKQISSIEFLRMDYAEKAASALAYSGFRDEMSSDISLLERLRGSLLMKFAEHPERLLRSNGSKETIAVSTPGFTATSSSGGGKSPDFDPVDKPME